VSETRPVVALAVITGPRGVLLSKRADRRPPWSFIGGEIKPGEDAMAAAVREVREETGAVAVALDVIGRRQHPGTGRSVAYVACRMADPDAAVGIADTGELLEVRWVDAGEAQLLMPGLHVPVADYLAWHRGSRAAIAQAARLAGPDAQVTAVRALAGGTHARTTLIKTANPELEVVLREFPPGDDAASRETRVLRALDGLGGLAPRLLGGGTDGVAAEGSWLVITRLPGAADITPDEPAPWAGQLGRALARLHATPLDRLAELPSVLDRPGGIPGRTQRPGRRRGPRQLGSPGQRAARADAP
jgi:8-oxo-dGTP pyrophosphatase MutT (NUDIX family)